MKTITGEPISKAKMGQGYTATLKKIGRIILLCLVGPIVAGLGSIPLLILNIHWDAGYLIGVHFVFSLMFGAVFGLAGGLIAWNNRYIGAAVGGIFALLPATCIMLGVGLSA